LIDGANPIGTFNWTPIGGEFIDGVTSLTVTGTTGNGGGAPAGTFFFFSETDWLLGGVDVGTSTLQFFRGPYNTTGPGSIDGPLLTALNATPSATLTAFSDTAFGTTTLVSGTATLTLNTAPIAGVPEPGTWLIFGLGAFAAMRRRRRAEACAEV
jgi:hypothetical protein